MTAPIPSEEQLEDTPLQAVSSLGPKVGIGFYCVVFARTVESGRAFPRTEAEGMAPLLTASGTRRLQ